MEDALRKLTEINAQTLQGIQTLAEEIRTSAAASSQRETGLTQAFQDTIASVQQQQAQAQQALADAQTNAVTTFEEIGSSLEKAVKERKPGEVELRKLIKAPDAFNPGNWQEEKSGWTEFRSRMRVWLGAVDNTMIRIMDIVERDLKEDKMVKIDDMSAEAKEASRRLYSVLCSYTKGRPYRVVKHVAEENGMEAYRMLLKEYQPTNRARSLELFHNILNYRFAQNKGIAENILEYKEKIEQYEKATGEKVQENLKVSTLIQGMKPEVKRHLLLNMDEKTKYSALRQYLVNYESTQKRTNSLSQGSGRTTTDLIEKGEDHGGLAMMDVSQAWYKGKGKWYKGLGKGKGKGKGKGGKDFGKGFGFEGKGFGGFGKGRGRGNWKGRGRGFRGYKGKGRGRGKGNRGFKGKGKGKAQAATGVCHYCHKYGHFEAVQAKATRHGLPSKER